MFLRWTNEIMSLELNTLIPCWAVRSGTDLSSPAEPRDRSGWRHLVVEEGQRSFQPSAGRPSFTWYGLCVRKLTHWIHGVHSVHKVPSPHVNCNLQPWFILKRLLMLDNEKSEVRKQESFCKAFQSINVWAAATLCRPPAVSWPVYVIKSSERSEELQVYKVLHRVY